MWDWYQSFVVVCESQREKSKKASPSKGKQASRDAAQEKGKGKDRDVEDEDGQWALETHARFIRALHELDHIGLIRHTGRKKDCVIRTVWEGEYE